MKARLDRISKTFADGDWIETKDQSPAGYRLIQTGNIGEGAFHEKANRARYVSAETFEKLNCSEVYAGDCLVSRLPDPIGRACIVPETGRRSITAVDCTIIRFDDSLILPRYFVYFSQSSDYRRQIEKRASGSTRQRISRAALGAIEVPLSSLTEQERTVTILDETFEAIVIAMANTEAQRSRVQEAFDSALTQATSPREGWTTLPFERALDPNQ